MTKLDQARALVAKVENDIGHPLDSHIIDLFFDNAESLGFSDDDCLTIGNTIRIEKGLLPVPRWWT